MKKKKTLVLGASANPARYSYLAVHSLREHDHPVVAIGGKAGEVADVSITIEMPQEKDIDTVSLYLNPLHQKMYYDYIISLSPKRIIFNPGTENNELSVLAEKKGIKTLEACTLVMLATGQY